jgi:hypothetical protein
MFVSLAELAAEHRELEARRATWLKKLAAYDRSGDWSADGFLNAASALRATSRIDHGVARTHVELARKLENLPQVAAAFARGEISQRHAAVVANACTPERAEKIAEVEAELVDVARQHTPKQLGGVVRYLVDAIDGEGRVQLGPDCLTRASMRAERDGASPAGGRHRLRTSAKDHPVTPARRVYVRSRIVLVVSHGEPCMSLPVQPIASVALLVPFEHCAAPPLRGLRCRRRSYAQVGTRACD